MTQNTRPVPTEDSTSLEKLEYEHAVLYEAYQKRGEELKEVEKHCVQLQNALNAITSHLSDVLRVIKGVSNSNS